MCCRYVEVGSQIFLLSVVALLIHGTVSFKDEKLPILMKSSLLLFSFSYAFRV